MFLKPPGSDEPAEQGALGSFCLAATTPGTPPLLLPPGMAKLVPAGWRFLFVLHYSPVGTGQTDQTSIGLVFADPQTVKKKVATRLIRDDHLSWGRRRGAGSWRCRFCPRGSRFWCAAAGDDRKPLKRGSCTERQWPLVWWF